MLFPTENDQVQRYRTNRFLDPIGQIVGDRRVLADRRLVRFLVLIFDLL